MAERLGRPLAKVRTRVRIPPGPTRLTIDPRSDGHSGGPREILQVSADRAGGYDCHMNVKRGEAKALGVDPEASGLLRVRVRLEPAPNREWTTLFINGPSGPMWPISMHPPTLSGGHVEMRPPDTELDAYIRELDDRIRATNEQYEREIAPRLKAAQDAKEAAKDAETKRIEDAQRRLDAG